MTSAVATVLLLVAIQAGFSTRIGEVAPAERIEQLLGAGDWSTATEVCWGLIYAHPTERRAHFYMSRCLLGKGLPELALQHLVLSATPRADETSRPLLPVPTKDEVDAFLQELEARYPSAMERDWSHLRKARLAAIAQHEGHFDEQLHKAVVATNSGGAHSFGPLANPFLGAVLGLDTEVIAGLTLGQEAVDRLVVLSGAKYWTGASLTSSGDVTLHPFAALAGGDYAGGEHRLWVGASEFRFPAADGWLFLALDRQTGSLVNKVRFELAPLTKERASLESWCAALADDVVIVGMAAGEITHRTSAEARNTLRSVLGLTAIPAQETLLPYAFIARRTPGGTRVVEAPGAARDVPAMIYSAGDES